MSKDQVAELREDIRRLNQTIISECKDIHNRINPVAEDLKVVVDKTNRHDKIIWATVVGIVTVSGMFAKLLLLPS
jgi:archaellum component FlaC